MSTKIKGTFLPFLGFYMLGFEVRVCVWEDGVYMLKGSLQLDWQMPETSKEGVCS